MHDNTAKIRSSRFRAEREADWLHLERLVLRAERGGVKALGFEEAQDLAGLYRQAMSSLAIAREISLDLALVAYLEALCARAYLTLYAPQEPVGGVFVRFFTKSAPRAMRRSWVFIALGFLCMLLGTLAGYLLFFTDESWFYSIMPGGLSGGRNPKASSEELLRVIYREPKGYSSLTAFASYLFSHNTRIAIFAFGLGVFACLPAVLLTFYNGLILGVFFALHVDRGVGWDLGGWLSVHGVTEISAICIACGGGLQLGAAALFPGRLSRRASLHRAGRDAVKLALVAALMLVVAALLEGFVRQLVQNITLRYVIGWGVGLLWLAWFVLAGRRRS